MKEDILNKYINHRLDNNLRTTPNDKTISTTSSYSLLQETKKRIGVEEFSDTSFILYLAVILYGIQRISDLYKLIKEIITLPKQVSEAYNFITKEDVILLDRVDDLMHRLMGITGADRIAIGKIHNGTYDNTGGHQMKFSIIYEITDRLHSTKDQVQNIPINFIKEEILVGSWTHFQRIERSNLDSLCDNYLDKIGIKMKDYKLLAVNRIIYGILDIHYIDTPQADFTLNKQLESKVLSISNEIEYCLQSIILKRNWYQRSLSKLFKMNPIFK